MALLAGQRVGVVMTKRFAPLLLLYGTVLCGTAIAQSGPAVATKWRINGEVQNLCLGHADESLRRNGFKPLGPGSQSMMGTRGEYTAQIRCVPEQQIVFFVVSGPSPVEANRLLDSVYRVWGP
jgi:hypothetical protein